MLSKKCVYSPVPAVAFHLGWYETEISFIPVSLEFFFVRRRDGTLNAAVS